MRVRIVKDIKNFKTGEVYNVGSKVAKFLLKNGYAIQSKDMVAIDYQRK